MKKICFSALLIFCGYHVIAQAIPTAKNDSLKYAANKKNISVFLNIINSAGIVLEDTPTLPNTGSIHGPFTIFIPDNQAFEKLTTSLRDSLLNPSNQKAIFDLFNKHTVAGILTSKDIAKQLKSNNGQATIITSFGSKLTAHINTDRNIVLTDENGNESIVRVFDIHHGFAMIFIIDSLIDYKK